MIPTLAAPDATLLFLRDGYAFVSKQCDRLGTDAFRTRIGLRPVVCLRGAEAADLLYRDDRFTRSGAIPASTVRLLQDLGSVQTLDGAAHRERKQMFLRALQGPAVTALPEVYARHWQEAVRRWAEEPRVVLHTAVRDVLARTALEWAGIPATETEIRRRTAEVSRMIDGAGSIGPVNWVAQLLRTRSERWFRRVVIDWREGRIDAGADTALAVVAGHREDGELLDVETAAVELLNVVRPMVAVARFVTFAALALHQHPQWRDAVAAGDPADVNHVVQEVRRYYPFFPVIGGIARRDVRFRDEPIREGQWALLDLYGTNHDPRLWEDPEVFRPERFRDWSGDPDTLVPQGAGDYADGHRCPGEPLTVLLMEESVRHLARGVRYDVGVQDLSVSLSRMPALPADGFVIRDVTAVGP